MSITAGGVAYSSDRISVHHCRGGVGVAIDSRHEEREGTWKEQEAESSHLEPEAGSQESKLGMVHDV